MKILKISKIQRQIYCKITKVSLNPLSSEQYVIDFYTHLFEDVKPMLLSLTQRFTVNVTPFFRDLIDKWSRLNHKSRQSGGRVVSCQLGSGQVGEVFFVIQIGLNLE